MIVVSRLGFHFSSLKPARHHGIIGLGLCLFCSITSPVPPIVAIYITCALL